MAVRVEDGGMEVELAVLDRGEGAEWHGAAAAELAEEIALGGDAAGRGFVVDGGEEREGGDVGFAALDCDGTLAGGREHFGDGCDLDLFRNHGVA